MSKHYRVIYPREYTTSDGEVRTDFVRIGRCFPHRDNDGFTLDISCLPVGMKPGELRLIVLPNDDNNDQDDYDQRPQNERRGNNNRRSGGRR